MFSINAEEDPVQGTPQPSMYGQVVPFQTASAFISDDRHVAIGLASCTCDASVPLEVLLVTLTYRVIE